MLNLAQKASDAVQNALLADLPDVVVATPKRADVHLQNSGLDLANLATLVIDEADLILSYEYGSDVESISRAAPNGVQTILMSATLTSDVDTLKGLFCKDPAILALDETEGDDNPITQYVVK